MSCHHEATGVTTDSLRCCIAKLQCWLAKSIKWAFTPWHSQFWMASLGHHPTMSQEHVGLELLMCSWSTPSRPKTEANLTTFWLGGKSFNLPEPLWRYLQEQNICIYRHKEQGNWHEDISCVIFQHEKCIADTVQLEAGEVWEETPSLLCENRIYKTLRTGGIIYILSGKSNLIKRSGKLKPGLLPTPNWKCVQMTLEIWKWDFF